MTLEEPRAGIAHTGVATSAPIEKLTRPATGRVALRMIAALGGHATV